MVHRSGKSFVALQLRGSRVSQTGDDGPRLRPFPVRFTIIIARLSGQRFVLPRLNGTPWDWELGLGGGRRGTRGRGEGKKRQAPTGQRRRPSAEWRGVVAAPLPRSCVPKNVLYCFGLKGLYCTGREEEKRQLAEGDKERKEEGGRRTCTRWSATSSTFCGQRGQP